jgi:hypothetical protein
MVRRWSRVNLTNVSIKNNSYKFYFKYLFKTFRKSLIFKKFYIKRTKFTRKKTTFLKHRFNWLPYSQIFKYWIKDFKNNKTTCKFQYLNALFKFNYLVFDKNFFKNKKNLNLFRTVFYISNFISRTFRLLFLKRNFNFNFNFFKNIPFLKASIYSKKEIETGKEQNLTILTLITENLEYAAYSKSSIVNLLQKILIKKNHLQFCFLKEIYKILFLLFFLKSPNSIKNVPKTL